MKDFDGIILAFFIIIVALLLFWGIKQVASKAFSQPPPENPNAQAQFLTEQRRRAKDTRSKARELQRQQERKIRDLQRMQNR